MEKVNAGIALKWLGQIQDILKSLFVSVYCGFQCHVPATLCRS